MIWPCSLVAYSRSEIFEEDIEIALSSPEQSMNELYFHAGSLKLTQNDRHISLRVWKNYRM